MYAGQGHSIRGLSRNDDLAQSLDDLSTGDSHGKSRLTTGSIGGMRLSSETIFVEEGGARSRPQDERGGVRGGSPGLDRL